MCMCVCVYVCVCACVRACVCVCVVVGGYVSGIRAYTGYPPKTMKLILSMKLIDFGLHNQLILSRVD